MLGQNNFWILNLNLQAALTPGNEEPKPFGGLHVILVGDFNQLQPVRDTVLHKKPLRQQKDDKMKKQSTRTVKESAYLLFLQFRTVVILKENMRLKNGDGDVKEFEDILTYAKRYQLNQHTKHRKALMKRHVSNLSEDEKLKFKDCVKIFRTNKEADMHNYSELMKLGNPIYKITAQAHKTSGLSEPDDDYMGLRRYVYLCKGAKVFMQMNMNTSIGLYNSSEGIVQDIVYSDNANPDEDQPLYVIVKFENYHGPKIDGEMVFPVEP